MCRARLVDTPREFTSRHCRLAELALAIALAICPGSPAAAADGYGAPPPQLDLHLQRLVTAYPAFIRAYDASYLHLANGTKFRISDGRTSKSFEQLLEEPDVDDMFYVAYPAGAEPKPPAPNADPGRVRYEPLFVAMYGDCNRGEVTKHLRSIRWLPRHGGGTISVTIVNGVDQALQRVSDELEQLPHDLVKYLNPSAGTYACRPIAGSRARSMHAYGAAIDLNTRFAHYWRWSGGPGRWRNLYPTKIVHIFEKHGFIWGGHWYHFDTMHFEYRPELLPQPKSR